ncbi:MAG: hypothetical protein PHE80_01110 [Candidatus Omnitrophica bacterium]|nr:hypothetical protein [Candidatus Omnitrophota bacterium]MDD5736743.1 hypothetical protein [Candidatus Omnitrophota bacterium]
MKLERWREIVRKYFPEYVLPAEIVLSVVCQLAIKDVTNPFGLVLVDRPSSGKTIVLNFFSKYKELVYVTDAFTASSFVTHASNRKKEELEGLDLLPRIKHKVFVVRDLAPIFGMRDDDLLKVMGILTRVFDGEGLTTDSGLYGRRGYKGDYLFMFLAASTPIKGRVWKVMGNFGSRLFFLNMGIPDKGVEVLAKQLRSKYSPKQKEIRCRKATKKLLEEIFSGVKSVVWDRQNENEELLKEIATISKLVASLRGMVNFRISDKDGFDFNDTQVEKADRINQAFYNLARGHAFACGRRQINDEDIAIALKVALSSAPWDRVKFFKLLIDNGGKLKTDDVIEELKVSRPTALKLIAIFKQLNIIYKEEVILASGGHLWVNKISPEFSWFIGPRFKELMRLIQSHI